MHVAARMGVCLAAACGERAPVAVCPFWCPCCVAQVCGACVFVTLFNRLVMPWFTSDYALEQLADALEQAALLFSQIYSSQLERMRLAELVAGELKQQGGTEALAVHINAAPAPPCPAPGPAAASAGADAPAAAASLGQQGATAAAGGQPADPAAALAACEAVEAQLLVVLRQQVLSRLVAVQLALAKESVSWKRGVLATPPLVLNVLGAMNAVKEALTSQRLALAPFTRQGAASMQEQRGGGAAGGGGGGGMLHMMEHCYSLWALPLHPVWMQVRPPCWCFFLCHCDAASAHLLWGRLRIRLQTDGLLGGMVSSRFLVAHRCTTAMQMCSEGGLSC